VASAESSAPSAAGGDSSPSEPAPEGLTLVHIIGTKYTDYFTDGTTNSSYPGDPNIDAHLAEKDAPLPTHEGLTWVHTTGAYLYDTPSGDLEIGDYAVQPSGSYIENPPPFVSSTSTPSTADSSSTPQTGASATSDQSTSAPPTTTDITATTTDTTPTKTDTTATTTP
jgi:hypothetical protein